MLISTIWRHIHIMMNYVHVFDSIEAIFHQVRILFTSHHHRNCFAFSSIFLEIEKIEDKSIGHKNQLQFNLTSNRLKCILRMGQYNLQNFSIYITSLKNLSFSINI